LHVGAITYACRLARSAFIASLSLDGVLLDFVSHQSWLGSRFRR